MTERAKAYLAILILLAFLLAAGVANGQIAVVRDSAGYRLNLRDGAGHVRCQVQFTRGWPRVRLQ